MSFKQKTAGILLAAFMSAAMAAPVPDSPAAVSPVPDRSVPAAASEGTAESRPEIAAVPYSPVPAEEDELPSWLIPSAAGAALFALILLVLIWRRSRARRLQSSQDAKQEFWNPVKVVSFEKAEDRGPNEEEQKAVEKTVDAVMKAEEELGRVGVAGDIMAGRPLDAAEVAEKEEPPLPDPETAYREMMAEQLAVAEKFASDGLLKEAAELASDIAKGKNPELAAKARELLKKLPAPDRRAKR